MSSEITPAVEESETSYSSSSSSSSAGEEDSIIPDVNLGKQPQGCGGVMEEGVRRLDLLDLRAVGKAVFRADLSGGDYQISQFLSSVKGHKHVTQLSPTPNSFRSLIDKIKEPSVLLLQGCDQLFSQSPQTQIPFHKFKALTTLEISGCSHLTALPQIAISDMTQLQTLNLSHLPIQEIPPNFLSKLTKLCSFILRECPNLLSLPKFPQLTALQCLDLSHLPVQTLPTNLFEGVGALRCVTLRGCSKLSSFPLTAPLQKLEVFDISYCTALKGFEYDCFWHRRLQMLDLSYTCLPRVPTLNDSVCLTHLFLRDTQVTGFYYLKGVTSLQVLDLSGAQNVRQIAHVQGNKDLMALDLSRTRVEALDFLPDLTSLRYLILQQCTGLVRLPSMLMLTNLELLDVSGCEILDELPEDISKLTYLKELNLCGCSSLRELREGLFDNVSCLEKLDLSKTNVVHLPSLAMLSNLLKLSLRGLELDSLESLAFLSSLVELDLKDLRSQQEINLDFLESLENLQILNLSQTCVAKLPDMSKHRNLKELLLANCPELQVVPSLQPLTNLEVLDLSLPDDYTASRFQEETESEAQATQLLSVPVSLQKLLLANRHGLLKSLPSDLLAKLECLDVQEVVGNNVQGNVPTHNELHLISTFMSNSGFERFKYGFKRVDDLISEIVIAVSREGNSAAKYVYDRVIKENIQNEALMMHADLRYILENIDLLESSRTNKSSEGILNELMDAATNSDDFALDSTNLFELRRMVVKLKLLLPPPKQVDGLETVTKEEEEEEKRKKKKNESRFTKCKKRKEVLVMDDVRDPQGNGDLLNSYDSLTEMEKNCLLCFSVFPHGEGMFIKKRILIHWWLSEGFIEFQHEGKPKAVPKEMESLKTIKEAGKQILKVLEEKGFIETVMNKRRESGSCSMQPFIHSFVMAQAEEKGFFAFHHKSRRLNPRSTRFQRACLLKSQDSFPSSCKLWANYSSSSKNLKVFNTIRTLFNVNERTIYIKSEWFSRMKDLHMLHLGSWQYGNEEHIEVVDQKFLEELKNMKQMRLLSLQGLSTIMKLPDSVCKLANLKILDLRYCTYLEELPAGIGSLKNLTYLDLTNCPILSKLPKGLSLLTKLEVLKGFVITYQIGGLQHRKACTLRELSKLERLSKLTLVVNKDIFPDSEDLKDLKQMMSLCNLEISWEKNYNISQEQDNVVEPETLRRSRWQKLKCWEQETMRHSDTEEPLTSNYLANLRKLALYCFPSEIAPPWLDPCKLHKLEKLYIVGGNLQTLPGDTMQNTWNVKSLRLKYLRNLYTNWPRLRGMFPSMTYFEHHKCDQLTLFPPGVWIESDEK